MTFYSEMSQTAQEMIAEFGRSVVLRRNNEGVYNPLTDTVTGSNATDITISAVFTDFKEKDIDGTLILRGDKQVLFAAVSLVPAPENNDILIDGADEYRIIELMAIQPGDTALIYKVQVRK